MKYDDLNKWLEKCDSPNTYDFVEDTQGEGTTRDYAEIPNAYERFFLP